jgi:isopentenyl phosphate kinase
MDEVVVIKWGGGLITDKARTLTPKPKTIAALARATKAYLAGRAEEATARRRKVVLVHGAGSFGHLRAKAWRLAEGRLPTRTAVFAKDPSREKARNQDDAVRLVREEMLQLNGLVCDALVREGLRPHVHPPHEWVRNTGAEFLGDLAVGSRFLADGDPLTVDVTFGDVVDVLDADGTASRRRNFGILSGDDLVVRLAKELRNVRRLIFAVGGGVDGLLSKPPSQGGNNKDHLLRELTPAHLIDPDGSGFAGAHWANDIDVTGGIGLKAIRGMQVAQHRNGAITVLVLNGDKPARVLAGMRGGRECDVVGTQIRAAPASVAARL